MRHPKFTKKSDDLKAQCLLEVRLGCPVIDVASRHGVHYTTLYDWIQKAGANPREAEKELKRMVEQLKAERDALKAALSFYLSECLA